MLLGHARGKVGDLVFSRVNGQQVTRARAAVVKNPQTEAQMIQRILLNTIIQAYSRMSEICDHSYEGIPVGQKSMAVFMRKNLNALRSRLAAAYEAGHQFDDIYAFSPLGSNVFAMNEYIISSGSLPAVNCTCDALTGGKVAIVAEGAELTYADVIDALGLQRGDQLTFVGQEAWTDSRAAFKFARVILDPHDSEGAVLPLDTPFLDGDAINAPSPRNEGEDVSFSYSNGNLLFTFGAGSTFGAAVIVSRQKADGTWMRSNAAIDLEDAMPYGLIGAYSLQDALDLFAAGGFDLQSDRYLNNAARRITNVPSPEPVEPSIESATFGAQAISKTGVTNIQSGEALLSVETEGVSQLTEPAVKVYDVTGGTSVLAETLTQNGDTFSKAFDPGVMPGGTAKDFVIKLMDGDEVVDTFGNMHCAA